MQILPNIYILHGSAYGAHVNFYLLHGREGTVIIDTGIVPADIERAEKRMQLWDVPLEKIDYIMLTHSHYDHAGNAALLKKRGATVVAGPGDAEGIERSDLRTIPYAEGLKVPPCKVDRVVTDGELVDACGYRFEVIHVPGHTDGSVIYQLRLFDKIIWFSGDLFFTVDRDYTADLCWRGGEEFDRKKYIKSLKRLSAMPVDCVLAGHLLPCPEEAFRLVGHAYSKALIELR
jgi:glyoxylase-like metal-dependent hydrolase (beta-lactamase superfamily II)